MDSLNGVNNGHCKDSSPHTCLMKFPEAGAPELQGNQTDIKYIKNFGNINSLVAPKNNFYYKDFSTDVKYGHYIKTDFYQSVQMKKLVHQ